MCAMNKERMTEELSEEERKIKSEEEKRVT